MLNRSRSVELVEVGVGQHVVRRCDQVVDLGVAVAKSGEGGEPWHHHRMPRRISHVLCDLDGVVWLAHAPIPGSVAAIESIRASGRRVLFVTNNSAGTRIEQEAALAAIGVEASGDVVTSAMAAAFLVEPGERVLVAGGPGVVEAVATRGATVVLEHRRRSDRTGRRRRGRPAPRLRLRPLANRWAGRARRCTADRDEPGHDVSDADRPRAGRRVDRRRGRFRRRSPRDLRR